MRKLELAANSFFLIPVVVVFTIIGVIAHVEFRALYWLGLLCLVAAITSRFRQGIWMSFGPSRLSADYRKTYWMGYTYILIGVFIDLAPALIARFGR